MSAMRKSDLLITVFESCLWLCAFCPVWCFSMRKKRKLNNACNTGAQRANLKTDICLLPQPPSLAGTSYPLGVMLSRLSLDLDPLVACAPTALALKACTQHRSAAQLYRLGCARTARGWCMTHQLSLRLRALDSRTRGRRQGGHEWGGGK
jgi:hypothetical protein